MVKLILADNHTLIREGIKSLLKEEKSIEILGEARNNDELFSLLSSNKADVVLMDICMCQDSSNNHIQRIIEQFGDLKILVLSPAYNEEIISQLFKEGAVGYIHQNSERDELVYAIRTVSRGSKFISPFITLNLLEKGERPTRQNALQFDHEGYSNKPVVDISNREKEVLFLIAQGYTNAEIADKLFTSKRTIESHRKNLIDKTKTKNTASLISFAFTNGILSDCQI